MSMQDAGVELFAACADNSCASGSERIVIFGVPAVEDWATLAANLGSVFGVTLTQTRARQMAYALLTQAAQQLAQVAELQEGGE